MLLPTFVQGQKTPYITKWINNKAAAVSLRFDDNLKSHVNVAIPLLNKYGLKGTFMVNPGRNSFKKHHQFWTVDVPKMGHHLGNHTMHHLGARNAEEAEYEIGEASRYILALYPENSSLLPFASGGGEKWGGKEWNKADKAYKNLVERFHLIDLYDGYHQSFSVTDEISKDQLVSKVQEALLRKGHQPFTFHHIGRSRPKDYIKKLLGGENYSIGTSQFEEFLDFLSMKLDQIWVAPLIQILKYEEEFNNSRLQNLHWDDTGMRIELVVGTDPTLFDQPLTIVFPNPSLSGSFKIFQGDRQIMDYRFVREDLYVNIKPMTSTLDFRFE